MKSDLTILSMAKSLAAHATTRQTLVAENIANADTKSFRARDVKSFAEVYAGPGAEGGGFAPAASRPGHVGYAPAGAPRPSEAFEIARLDSDSPNGNSVSVEDQMVRAAAAQADHEMALTILRKSVEFIRAAVSRGR